MRCSPTPLHRTHLRLESTLRDKPAADEWRFARGTAADARPDERGAASAWRAERA